MDHLISVVPKPRWDLNQFELVFKYPYMTMLQKVNMDNIWTVYEFTVLECFYYYQRMFLSKLFLSHGDE